MYMIFWILQRIIVSLVLILCAHYIFIFLKTNLTTPKVKDLVNKPKAKYEQIYNSVPQETSSTNEPSSDMKSELQNYLSELSKSNKSTEPSGAPVAQNDFFDNNYQSL